MVRTDRDWKRVQAGSDGYNVGQTVTQSLLSHAVRLLLSQHRYEEAVMRPPPSRSVLDAVEGEFDEGPPPTEPECCSSESGSQLQHVGQWAARLRRRYFYSAGSKLKQFGVTFAEQSTCDADDCLSGRTAKFTSSTPPLSTAAPVLLVSSLPPSWAWPTSWPSCSRGECLQIRNKTLKV